jgi:hypothetical protein
VRDPFRALFGPINGGTPGDQTVITAVVQEGIMDTDHTSDPKQRDLEPCIARRDTGYLTTQQGSGLTTPTIR